MIHAINNYHIEGVKTTLAFGKFVCEHDAFRSGHFDTHFVKKHYTPETLQSQAQDEAKLTALIAVKQYLKDQQLLRLPN